MCCFSRGPTTAVGRNTKFHYISAHVKIPVEFGDLIAVATLFDGIIIDVIGVIIGAIGIASVVSGGRRGLKESVNFKASVQRKAVLSLFVHRMDCVEGATTLIS